MEGLHVSNEGPNIAERSLALRALLPLPSSTTSNLLGHWSSPPPSVRRSLERHAAHRTPHIAHRTSHIAHQGKRESEGRTHICVPILAPMMCAAHRLGLFQLWATPWPGTKLAPLSFLKTPARRAKGIHTSGAYRFSTWVSYPTSQHANARREGEEGGRGLAQFGRLLLSAYNSICICSRCTSLECLVEQNQTLAIAQRGAKPYNSRTNTCTAVDSAGYRTLFAATVCPNRK